MAFFHHGTMRKYTGALLQYFNDLEVQYQRSTGEYITKPIPIVFKSREKSRVLDTVTSEQLLDGNYNVLPRANLTFISLQKSEQRSKNKTAKINSFKADDMIQYSYNSVPYEFLYDVVVQCRGMNEATQIIEQVAPRFNPLLNIDIWEVSNLTEPTRIPITLSGISLEEDEYEEFSANILTVTFSLSMMGNLYPPIMELPQIKEFKLYINEILNDDDETTQRQLLEWDVDNDGIVIDP